MVFSADLHMGDTADCVDVGGIPSKVVDTALRLRELVDEATRHRDKTLILAGDIFDSTKPLHFVIEALFNEFKYASTQGVKLILIPGNHDCDVKWSSLAIPAASGFDHVFVVSWPRIQKIGGVPVLFLPHVPKRQEDDLLSAHGSYERVVRNMIKEEGLASRDVLLVTHAQVFGVSVRGASELEMEAGTAIPLNVDKLPPLRGVILGHVHRAQEFKHISHNFPLFYCGPLVPHSFGESDDAKTFMTYDVDSGFDMLPYKTRIHEYRTVKINALSGEVELDDAKLRKMRGKLLKLVIHCTDRDAVDEIGLRDAFNKYGTVLRMEFVVHVDESRRAHIDADAAILDDLNHEALLQEYLAEVDCGTSVRALALSLGKEIIQSCLSE